MTLIQQPGDGLPDNLPLLTEVADENVPDDLPTLTEVVIEEQAKTTVIPQPTVETTFPASCAPADEETQQLLQRLETHLENVFIRKLSLNLEQLQRQAVEQAISELKAELPRLLRDALKAHPKL